MGNGSPVEYAWLNKILQTQTPRQLSGCFYMRNMYAPLYKQYCNYHPQEKRDEPRHRDKEENECLFFETIKIQVDRFPQNQQARNGRGYNQKQQEKHRDKQFGRVSKNCFGIKKQPRHRKHIEKNTRCMDKTFEDEV